MGSSRLAQWGDVGTLNRGLRLMSQLEGSEAGTQGLLWADRRISLLRLPGFTSTDRRTPRFLNAARLLRIWYGVEPHCWEKWLRGSISGDRFASLRGRLPVQQERDGGGGIVQNRVDQEPAVAGHVVLRALRIVEISGVCDQRPRDRWRQCHIKRLTLSGGWRQAGRAEETAEVLQMSAVTVMRDWQLAKVWLARQLKKRESNARRTVATS